MKKRILTLLLAVALVLTMIPLGMVTVFADNDNDIFKVVFVGDSITAGVGAGALWSEGCYPSLVQDKLDDAFGYGRVIVTNAAYSGRRAYDFVEAETATRKAVSHNPDVIFITLGTNDGMRGHNSVAYYSFDDKSTADVNEGYEMLLADIDTLLEDYKALYNIYADACPNAEIVVCSPIRVNSDAHVYVDFYREKFVEMVTAEGWKYFDLYNTVNSSMTDEDFNDALHPSASGYVKMADAYYNYLTTNTSAKDLVADNGDSITSANSSFWPAGNTVQRTDVSVYAPSGNGIAFTNKENTAASPTLDFTTPSADTDAIALWLSVPNDGEVHKVYVGLFEKNTGNTPLYAFKTRGAAAYTIGSDGTVDKYMTGDYEYNDIIANEDPGIILDPGFEGYIVVPVDSFILNNGYTDTDNGTFDIDKAFRLNLIFDGISTEDYFVVDSTLYFSNNTDKLVKSFGATVYEAPTADVTAEVVAPGTEIKLSSVEGTTIRYTVDGSEPTETSPVYTDAIVLENDTAAAKEVVVKAKAFGNELRASKTAVFTYTVSAPSTVLADFENEEDYTLSFTSPNTDAQVVDGALNYRTNSGWAVDVKFNAASDFIGGANSVIAFHVDVPASETSSTNYMSLGFYEANGTQYYINGGSKLTLISDDMITISETTITNGTWTPYFQSNRIPLPTGFSGYLVINSADLVKSNAEADDAEFNINELNFIKFLHVEGTAQNDITYAVDNITIAADKNDFINTKAIIVTPSVENGSTVELGSKLELDCGYNGAEIYYTTDGSVPTKESTKYTRPITMVTDLGKSAAVTVKVVVVVGDVTTAPMEFTYNVDGVFDVMLDFDTVTPNAAQPQGDTASSEEIASKYGNAHKFSGTVEYVFNSNKNIVNAEGQSIVFYLEVPEDSAVYWPVVMMQDKASRFRYGIGGVENPVTLINAETGEITAHKTSTNNGSVSFPAGFKGWVALDTANIADHWGSAGGADIVLANTYVFTLFGGGVVDWVIDEIGVVSDVDTFVRYAVAKTQAPTITEGGLKAYGSTVTITAEEDAVVYYTTDGSEPTTESAVYTGPITLDKFATVTIKAMAVIDGFKASATVSATYTTEKYTSWFNFEDNALGMALIQGGKAEEGSLETVAGEFFNAGFATVKGGDQLQYNGVVNPALAGYNNADSAFVMWVKTPETEDGSNHKAIKLCLSHAGGAYTRAANKEFYLIDKNGVKTVVNTNQENMVLPSGFEGWIVLPYTSLTVAAGWSGSTQYEFDFAQMKYAWILAQLGDMTGWYFDELGVAGNVEAFCENAPKVVRGDVNNDGDVDIRDLIGIKNHIAGTNIAVDKYNTDCNKDAKVNLKDIVSLKRFLLGTIVL